MVYVTDDVPLRLPILFSENAKTEGAFKTRYSERYGLTLRIEPHYTSKGIAPLAQETCEFEWTITNKDVVVASGTTASANAPTYCSSFAYRSGTFYVGQGFDAKANETYQLTILGKGTKANLKDYDPVIEVKLTYPHRAEFWGIVIPIFAIISIVLSASLLLLWVIIRIIRE